MKILKSDQKHVYNSPYFLSFPCGLSLALVREEFKNGLILGSSIDSS